jgi:Tfp pilus assembly protein PilN
VLNVTRYLSLSSHVAAASETAVREEQVARDLTNRAAAIRRSIDPKALERVTKAAVEANAIIDARAFSWTAFFNDIESTLPPNVMLTAVTPSPIEGGIRVRLVVLGRTVEGIDAFIERLEETRRFTNVLAVAEQVNDQGLFQTTIEGGYRDVPQADRPAPTPAPAAGPTAGTPGGAP